jgi:hypothetical protein
VNPRLTDPQTGKTGIPDAVTSSGRPVELKPNTASDVKKGEQQSPKYKRATDNKGRVVIIIQMHTDNDQHEIF